MNEGTINLIYEEVKASREVLSEILQRLTVVETQTRDVVGGEQQGRLPKLEEKVSKLYNYKFYLLGAAVAAGAIVSLICKIIF